MEFVLSVCLYTYIYLFIVLSISSYYIDLSHIYIYIYMSIYLFIYLHIYLFTCACKYVYLSTYLHLSIFPSIYLSILYLAMDLLLKWGGYKTLNLRTKRLQLLLSDQPPLLQCTYICTNTIININSLIFHSQWRCQKTSCCLNSIQSFILPFQDSCPLVIYVSVALCFLRTLFFFMHIHVRTSLCLYLICSDWLLYSLSVDYIILNHFWSYSWHFLW